MKICSSLYHDDDDKGVFRNREFVTFRTIDDLIALKTRWTQTDEDDQEILMAIAGASRETPEEVVIRHFPGLSDAGVSKRIYRAFEKFKKGLLECRQEGFYIVFEAMLSIK